MSSKRDSTGRPAVAGPGRGLLFIVSAPSGTGKTTVVECLVKRTPNLAMSRSYTSRAMRAGETDGVDYTFVTRQRFEAMIAAGEFLEWADVFGNLYGTRAADTDRHLAAGTDVVLVIDVQGARKVRGRGVVATTVFVRPHRSARTADSLSRKPASPSKAKMSRMVWPKRSSSTASASAKAQPSRSARWRPTVVLPEPR